MSATLPHGLIQISHSITQKHQSLHSADILYERSNVLHTFWKVHSVRNRVTKDSTDFRCENLFWRTWGDSELASSITTSTLTSLWASCQQNIDRKSLQSGVDDLQKAINQAFPVSTELRPAPDQKLILRTPVSPDPNELSDQHEGFIHSIPKKGEIIINASTGLGITIQPGGRRDSKGTRPGIARASSSSNRTSFGASNGKTKVRPTLSRRKSSQSTVQSKSAKAGKPSARSPMLPSKEVESNPKPRTVSATSRFELPPTSSWEDEPIAGYQNSLNHGSHAETSSQLVEPNFRNKFAERIASSSNLAGMDRLRKAGSVVRFADETSPDLARPHEKEHRSVSNIEQRSSLSYRSSVGSVASIAVVDEDDDDDDDILTITLPRTKSQLSLMIEDTRAKPDYEHFDSRTSPTDADSIHSPRNRELTEEEKVLAMAHAEGVTRAGGRRIRRGFKFSEEDESRYSSPSPPPLF